MAFPKRFQRCTPPNYPDLTFQILANPIGAVYDALIDGDASTDENKAKLGAALVEAYAGGTVEGYGLVFDFSTPEKAITTLQHADTPIDLRMWLRNAPTALVAYEREQAVGNFRSSLTIGS